MKQSIYIAIGFLLALVVLAVGGDEPSIAATGVGHKECVVLERLGSKPVCHEQEAPPEGPTYEPAPPPATNPPEATSPPCVHHRHRHHRRRHHAKRPPRGATPRHW